MSLYVDNYLAEDYFCRWSDSHESDMSQTKKVLMHQILRDDSSFRKCVVRKLPNSLC